MNIDVFKFQNKVNKSQYIKLYTETIEDAKVLIANHKLLNYDDWVFISIDRENVGSMDLPNITI